MNFFFKFHYSIEIVQVEVEKITLHLQTLTRKDAFSFKERNRLNCTSRNNFLLMVLSSDSDFSAISVALLKRATNESRREICK